VFQKILPKHCNRLQKQLLNIFHSSDLPIHFNKTGNKEFTNYQRVSVIILFVRSKKSLRDFILEFQESKWISWLGLKKIPGKSTLHDWIVLFDMKIIRKIYQITLPNKILLASIDGTGFDSWQRSRQYERKIGDPYMPYVKADLFIDTETLSVIDFNLSLKKIHDVKVAEKIFSRKNLRGITILGDKGYDSEPLHELVRNKGGIFYAPIRKMSKKGLKRKRPKGRFRRECISLPDFMGQRSMNETVNSSLKRRQIPSLRCRKFYLNQREFGWHIILYNLRIKIKLSSNEEGQTFFYLILLLCPFRTEPKIIFIVSVIRIEESVCQAIDTDCNRVF
jgi:hypothetical protein